jgi:prepilin-type N-terminal cleavage/methylation domain-containing protein
MLSQIWAGKPALLKRRNGLAGAGFTLIELMIVITIILILIGMAVGRYDRSVQKANEAVLKNNLQTIRATIHRGPRAVRLSALGPDRSDDAGKRLGATVRQRGV